MAKEQQIEINLPEDVAQGTYSNLAVITHSHAEFIVDFVAMLPGIPKGNVRSRIIMTPQNAKRLLKALNDNIKKFEDRHGVITDGTSPDFIPVLGGNAGKA